MGWEGILEEETETENISDLTPQSTEGASTESDQPTPDNSDVVAAHFRQENSVYQLWKAARIGRLRHDGDMGKPGLQALVNLVVKDPEFDLQQTLDNNGIEGEDRKFFADVRNREEFNNALDYFYQKKEDEKIMQNASFMQNLCCGVVAGAADPVNWVPVGRAMKFGTPIVRTAVEGALVGGVSYSIRSGANNNFDTKELMFDTIAGGITAGLLTGIGKGVTKGIKYLPETQIYKDTKEAFKEMLIPNVSRWFEMEDGQVVQVSEGMFGTVKQKAKRVIWSMVNNAPVVQMYNSGNELLRKLSGRIFRNRVSNLRGENEVATVTVEEALNLYEGESFALSDKVNKLRQAFIDKGGTAEEFNKGVGKTIVNGDYITLGDTNSEIGKAAQMIMEFDDQILDRAEKYGALEEGFGKGLVRSPRYVVDEAMMKMPKEDFERAVQSGDIQLNNVTAVRHIVRKYNQKAIDDNIEEIAEILDREILLNNPKLKNEKIEEIRNKIITNITERNPEYKDVPFSEIPFKAKILAERQVAIHDDLLLDLGIIDYDPVTNHTNALRQVVVDTELNRIAQELKFASWSELKKEMDSVSKQMPAQALLEKGTAYADATSEAHKYNLELLNNAEALLKGTFTNKGIFKNNKVLQWISDAKELVFASTAGKLVLSMIPDMASIALRTGASRLVKRFVFPQATLKKADKETLKSFLNFLDASIRRNRFRDMGYTPENTSAIAKFSEKIASFETKYTGVDRLNRILKETAAEEIYSQLIENCVNLKSDLKYLNKMGITEEYRNIIAETYNKYGNKYKNIFYVDPNYFENEELSRQIKASVTSLVNQTILSPGVGDIPRFLRSQLGSFTYMFLSYGYLVMNNVMRPLLRGDISSSKFAQALTLGLTLSYVRKYISDAVDGKDTDPSSIEFWKEVWGYSMGGNCVTDAIFTAERLWNSQSPASSASPTLAWFNNLIGSIKDLTQGRFTRRVRNTIPGLNMWWLRPATNQLTDNRRKRSSL